MSSVNTRKDTTTADILNQLRQDIAKNKAKNTASNNFTITQLIPQDDSIAITDTVTNTELDVQFKITDDAGGGVTPTNSAGKIDQSVITEPNSAQITNDSGDGSGVMAPGIIDSVTALVQEISVE